MARKQIRVSRRMLFIWLMLAGFILLFSPRSLTNQFSFAFFHIFQWPLSVGRNFALSAQTQETIENVQDQQSIKYRNYVANLEQTLAQQRLKLQKLYGLYNGSVWENVDFALADVITATISGPRNELRVDCRKTTGLVKGQFVLADNSIIGTITDLFSHTACVRLFTDTSSETSVQIGNSDVKRVMQGLGNNTAKIKYVTVEQKVNIGDKVFAYRQPGFLDAPMIIGIVAQCKRDGKDPLLWDITVKPACDVEKLNDVAIIIMNPRK